VRISPLCFGRQQQQLSFLSEYTSDFRYLPGLANIGVDMLSRPSVVVLQLWPSAKLPVPQADTPVFCCSCQGNVHPGSPSVTVIPQATVPIYYAKMASLQTSCPDVTHIYNSTILFIVERTILGTLFRGTFLRVNSVCWYHARCMKAPWSMCTPQLTQAYAPQPGWCPPNFSGQTYKSRYVPLLRNVSPARKVKFLAL
jgi:hypothetical protein